jgi:hypothetical protein
MKRIPVPAILVLSFLILACPGVRPQDTPGFVGERIRACTDRTMYVSGETVNFTVLVTGPGKESGISPGRVFNCELIMPDGKQVTGGKYPLVNSSGQGCLKIPSDAISGCYYLKFYTRVMRNWGPGNYTYVQLKIINPDRTEVLHGEPIANIAEMTLSKKPVSDSAGPEILSINKSYLPGEEIRLNVKAPASNGSLTRTCLSVVPLHTYAEIPVTPEVKEKTPGGTWYPETRGVSLSGQVIVKETRDPAAGAQVYLSVIGDRDITVRTTRSDGRFSFALTDHSGNRDIFLCAGDLASGTPEILVDNDFCTLPVRLPAPVFSLDADEKEAAFRLAVNAKISSAWATVRVEDTVNRAVSIPFYGRPTDLLILDKYIELPTLREYFTDLPVMVYLKKVKGKTKFRFNSDQPDMAAYDPLLLVDWVAVDDPEKILAMQPRDIDRVELVNAPYIKGNTIFGGIISLVSKNNDFAGISLPASGKFINYSFFEDCADSVSPGPVPANIPDSRNTVYWNPDLKQGEMGTAPVSFTAPATPGDYIILLQTMEGNGTYIKGFGRFRVK